MPSLQMKLAIDCNRVTSCFDRQMNGVYWCFWWKWKVFDVFHFQMYLNHTVLGNFRVAVPLVGVFFLKTFNFAFEDFYFFFISKEFFVLGCDDTKKGCPRWASKFQIKFSSILSNKASLNTKRPTFLFKTTPSLQRQRKNQSFSVIVDLFR